MATANNLGTAYIKIAPQMQGIQSTIASALGNAGTTGGESFNKSFSLKAGAIAGIVSAAAQKAISAITNQLDAAITRVDTLNVFPKIMKNLGYETDESTRSIERLTQRIEGLPTTLDEIVTWTQRLASSMNSLADGEMNATDLAIAFNDAALSGGKGQAEANRAFEQYVQIIGRGRPMMQDWKIMLEVMPGQLKQMAKYLGENSASLQEYAKNAQKTVDQLDGMDLYEWISEDKNAYARERLAEFNEALVKLDKEGGAGITAFKDQVGDATHTIGTAMRLIGVRISKALATVIQAFGATDIYDAIDSFTKSFAKVGKWVAENIVPPLKNEVFPVLKEVFKVIKDVAQAILQNDTARRALLIMLETFIAFKAVAPIINTVTSAVGFFTGAMTAAQAATLGIGIAIAGVVVALNVLNEGLKLADDMRERNNSLRQQAASYIVNESNALRGLNQQRENEKKILDDLNTAKQLQNNAEYQELQAKQNLEAANKAYGAILKDVNATEDEKRMKYLELIAAQEAYTKACEDHKKAIADTNALDKERQNNLMAQIDWENRLAGAELLKQQRYGDLAKALDSLKDKTITYTNAQGEVITKTAEEMQEVSKWYAWSLRKNDETWANIVYTAEKEGISLVEACARAGFQAGETFDMRFAASLEDSSVFVLNAEQSAIDDFRDKLATNLEVNKFKTMIRQCEFLGINIMDALDSGMKSRVQNITNTINDIGFKIPSALKSIWQIHSPSKVFANIGRQVDEGLIQGLDSYSDDIAQKAQGIADSVTDPFNRQTEIGFGANNYSSYSGNVAGLAGGQASQVVQNNTFNQVADDLDVEEASKLLGWQVATAL